MNHIDNNQLTDYLNHALAPEDDAAVYAHVQSCATCAAALREETALTEALRRLAAAEERDFPQGVQATIWSRVEELSAAPSFADRVRAWLRPAFLVPLAAVVVLALVFAPQLFHGPTQTIDAAYYLDDHAAVNGTIPFGDASETVPGSLTGNAVPVNTKTVAIDPVTLTADAP